MKTICGTYRKVSYEMPVNIDGKITLNGGYTPSSKLSAQFADWTQAGLTKIVDTYIPEEHYTSEIAPGVNKLTRFIIGEYNETYVDPVEFARSMENVGAEFNIEIFASNDEAAEWIRENTDLEEVEPKLFLVSPEYNDPILGAIPAKYLDLR